MLVTPGMAQWHNQGEVVMDNVRDLHRIYMKTVKEIQIGLELQSYCEKAVLYFNTGQ